MARSLLALGYNFYLPLSLVEENMRRAQLENAVKRERFFVRRTALDPSSCSLCVPRVDADDIVELTLDEFVNGQRETAEEGGSSSGEFPGVVPALLGYLEALGCSDLLRGRFTPYLSLIQKRCMQCHSPIHTVLIST
jgi:glutamate--cysteine ligase catalytic subunit